MSIPLYFTGSISNNDKLHLPTRKAIVKTMQEFGKVLDDHVAQDNALELADQMKRDGINVYTYDTNLLDKAVAGVAEISSATTGGGGEIERMANQGKPLLIMHHKDTRGSWYVNDMHEVFPNVTYKTYSSQEEALAHTREFLSNLPKQQNLERQGLFIVCEGIDGCGKGTQAGKLVDFLFKNNKRHHILYTREPGRSDYGAEIRKILKEESDPYKRGIKLAELFVTDRKNHIEKAVQPILDYGGIAVCDRYKHSTLTYQSAQGIPMEELIKMHEGLPVPDLTLIFDLPVDEALRRVSLDEQRDYKEVFEKKDFQEQLKQKYLELHNHLDGEKIVTVDSNRSIDEIFSDVLTEVKPLLYRVK